MSCQTCGGFIFPSDAPTQSRGIPCSCVLQFHMPNEEPLSGEFELLYLQNRQNQLREKFAELKEMLHCKDSKFIDNNAVVHPSIDEAELALTSARRRTYSRIPKPIGKASPNVRPAKSLHPTPSLNEDSELSQAAKHTPEKAPVDECDLLKIREEIGQLRRQIEGRLQSMQDILQDNLHSVNKTPDHSRIEGKENSMPKSILTSAQQDFIDAVRHRQMLEVELAASERAQARRDIFDILGNVDDRDDDVLRMRALLDDAVCSIDASRRLKDSSVEKPKPISRIDRLSGPKQQAQVKSKAQQPRLQKRPTTTTTTQRPQSLRPTAKETELPVRWPAGLADICSSSIAAETRTKAAPLMKRPKVVIPPPAAPKARSVHFEETPRSQPAAPGKVGDAVTRKKTAIFVPLGMRQYSMWYPDNKPASAPPQPPSVHEDERITQILSNLASSTQQGETASKLTGDDIRAMLETIVSDRLAERQSQPQRPPQRDANVCTSQAASVEEKSLSPIHSLRKITFTDAASSPKPTPELISRGQSVQSTAQALQRSFSLPSVTSEEAVTADALRSAHTGPHSPILAVNEHEKEEEEEEEAEVAVTTEETLATATTQMEDVAESGTSSLTEPRSFSDGVWLDPDRSEGEACGLPSPNEAAQLAAQLGQLPSSSEASDSATALSDERKSRSEGEFTLDLINQHPGNWIPPWRDPLLHLVASNTAGKNARLHWSQAQEVKQIAAELSAQDVGRGAGGGSGGRPADSLSSGLDESELFTPRGSSQSEGEVDLLAARRRELRRAILSRSSQRMRQREVSLSDDEVTLTGTVEDVEAAAGDGGAGADGGGEVNASEKTDFLSGVKELSVDEDEAEANRTFQLSNDGEVITAAAAASGPVTSVSEAEEPF